MAPVNSEFDAICNELRPRQKFTRADVQALLMKRGYKKNNVEAALNVLLRKLRETGFAVYEGHSVGWRVMQ